MQMGHSHHHPSSYASYEIPYPKRRKSSYSILGLRNCQVKYYSKILSLYPLGSPRITPAAPPNKVLLAETLNPTYPKFPKTPNPKTPSPKPRTLNPKPYTPRPNPKPYTLNPTYPIPLTPNFSPQTINPI